MDSATTISDSVPFDFRQGRMLSERQKRFLRQRHEALARGLADRLTLWLRSDFALRLTRVEAVTYAGFVGGLAETTHLTLFKMEPWCGVCLLETPPALATAVVERLLGGAGERLGETRELTEVEIALFDQWAEILFEEWQQQFPAPPAPKLHLLGHENAPRFLQSAPPDTLMIEVVFEATFAAGKVPVQLAFPYATLEPLLRQAAALDEPAPPAAAPPPGEPPTVWSNVLDDMKLKVSAHWTGLEMTARALGSLHVGDVIQLSPAVASEVLVRVAGRTKFAGRLGTCDGQWAVELTGPAAHKPS